MNKNTSPARTIFSLIVLFTLAMYSCEESPRLFGKQVELYSPHNGAIYDTTLVSFYWADVAGASFYTLKVSSEDNQKPLLDTAIFSNSFTAFLAPGNYLWRVDAENYRSITSSETYSFSIDTSISYTDNWNAIVELKAPSDSSQHSSDENIILWWAPLDDVYTYELLVVSPSFSDPKSIVIEDQLYNHRMEDLKLDSGTYQWSVRAVRSVEYYENGVPQYSRIYSPYSTRTLFVD